MSLRQVKFKRLHENARLPVRAGEAAGFDLWPLESGTIFPGEIKRVALGIASEFSPGYAALIQDKSGPGFRGLIRLAGVIDADYRGEWIVKVFNCGDMPIGFTRDKAICQVLFVPAQVQEVLWVDALSETVRGAGMEGSSGH